MRNKLLIIAAVVLLAPLNIAAEPAKPAAPVVHVSPEAVYKAYREACQKRDWRTVFSCYTAERQKYELFECYFASQTKRETPQLLATLKKHGLEEAQANAEAVRVYEQKHRVKYTPDAKIETELLYEAIFNLVADKPGFFDEMCNHLLEPGPMKVSELENVKLQEQTATGQITVDVGPYVTQPGQQMKKIEQLMPSEVRFAKVNGGWLLAP